MHILYHHLHSPNPTLKGGGDKIYIWGRGDPNMHVLYHNLHSPNPFFKIVIKVPYSRESKCIYSCCSSCSYVKKISIREAMMKEGRQRNKMSGT